MQAPESRRRRILRALQTSLGFVLSHWPKLFVLGVIITLIVLVSIHGFAFFGEILSWFKARDGWGGWGVYVGFYTAVVSLFFPGIVFIMGAGFVFGFWRGLLAVWIGGSVGQALAFLLARYLLRDWVESMVRSRWKKWTYIDAAIENEGWKLVLVMRLSPIIPYNMLNIGMALTSMHLVPFTIVSSIGIIFECSIFVYLGTMADSITSIVAGESGTPKAYRWVLMGLSIAGCVITAVMVSIIVRRAIKRAEAATRIPNRSSSGDMYDLSEEESLLSTMAPSALQRESFVDMNNFDSPPSGVAKFRKDLRATLSAPLQTLSDVGQIPLQFMSPARLGSSKAKSSPPGSDKGGSAKPSFVEGEAMDSTNHRSCDVELGSQHTPATASRRRSGRSEGSDHDIA